MKALFKIITLCFLLGCFSNCKKYPENTLWFKNINNIHFFGAKKLTKFTVNGIDSLELLNVYFGSKAYRKKIDECSFELIYPRQPKLQGAVFFAGGTDAMIDISPSYSRNKKYINIVFGGYNGNYDTAVFRRNLFIDNNTPWEIIKLDTKTGTRKIKKTVNNNTYELQFENISN